jgi:mono/diheme cytochrome c family protein
MRFLAGMVTAWVLLGVVAVAVLLTGAFNPAAIAPPGALEKRLAAFALDRSVARRAPRGPNPLASSAAVARGGLGHYREMCVSCHGAPGVDPSEAGVGLNPPAPDLTLARVQKRTDGELFWILQNGIRMTGMPAFGPTHKDEEIWKLVAFLRHLPELTPEEEKLLGPGEGREEAHPQPLTK